jgi:hypothetical protein
VWILSVGFAIGLATVDGYGIFMDVDGNDPRSSSWCWIKSDHSRTFFSVNRSAWILFDIPVFVLVLLGIAIFVFAIVRLKNGLQKTHQTRLIVLVNNSMNVLVSILFWT